MASAYETYFASLAGKRVALLGFGVSNRPLLPLLCRAGAVVSIRDSKTDLKLQEDSFDWREYNIQFHLGETHMENMDEESIIRSPGLLPTLPALRKAAANGSIITSEMELFFALCPCKVIGITGSNGKTTTSALVSKILETAGHSVYLGGNIGTPLLPVIPKMTEDSIAVVELSSFQLMDMGKSPSVAVVTNVAPNHLDKHTDMDEYVTAKEAIFAFQRSSDLLVANFDNDYTRSFLQKAKGRTLAFSDQAEPTKGIYAKDGVIYRNGTPVLEEKDMILPGRHNVQNMMAAIGATVGLAEPEHIQKVAKTFGGVEHRMEFVREYNGVSYYNSSIDSSPSRTVAALSCFTRPVVLLAGGYDKHIPFEPMAESVIKTVRHLILTGHTAEKIENAVVSHPKYRPGYPEISHAENLEQAVQLAAKTARAGEAVLLSPACASFDAFANFEERGKAFKEAVRRLS
ncbi:MAG TPA: UDP-N-acetylmuramoyl-L-alanine--D-glutamate ligase [Clostridiales bacterium]|nr:UDP-N-acetylmuramoyl-L-alanine--D-glutamate ligase [Clostridiales bacterium]